MLCIGSAGKTRLMQHDVMMQPSEHPTRLNCERSLVFIPVLGEGRDETTDEDNY